MAEWITLYGVWAVFAGGILEGEAVFTPARSLVRIDRAWGKKASHRDTEELKEGRKVISAAFCSPRCPLCDAFLPA